MYKRKILFDKTCLIYLYDARVILALTTALSLTKLLLTFNSLSISKQFTVSIKKLLKISEHFEGSVTISLLSVILQLEVVLSEK